jgi:phosphoglycolate phosphatase
MRVDSIHFDAAIVDLDGTMVDTVGDFVEALNLVLDDLLLPHVDATIVSTLIGKGSEHLIRAVLRHVHAAPDDGDAAYERAWARYQHHYRIVNGRHSRVFDGVVEGLAGLRAAGLRLACLTNKPTEFARALLIAKGLDGFFDHVFGGDAFERKKPDPLPVLKCCEALGCRPARTLLIGDSSNDAAAARAAGCPVVLVSYGYNHGKPVLGAEVDGVVDSLAELTP